MNLTTIAVAMGLLGSVGVAIAYLWRRKRSGSGSCSCSGCGSCPNAGNCHR